MSIQISEAAVGGSDKVPTTGWRVAPPLPPCVTITVTNRSPSERTIFSAGGTHSINELLRKKGGQMGPVQ
jgi:hypothetical protein